MPRQGKCTNYAGCLLAYRNETIIIPEGDFVCPECQQPLTPVTLSAESSPKMVPIIIVGGIALLIVIGTVAVYTEGKRISRNRALAAAGAGQGADANAGSVPSAMATPIGTPPMTGATTPGSEPLPPPPTRGTSPAPALAATETKAETKVSALNLDLKNEENQKVKSEVLKRIDLMPTISAENKDKLYVSVERARKMGRIITIPFGKGKTAPSAEDVEKLKTGIASIELRQLLEDPTCVFVVLGFADTKGDEKTNLKISQDRAQSVLNTLRDKCGIQNVMHAVGMGGSTLFNEQGQEKNRVAEVWAVLP